jgi:GT2 family glycosyltransferase
MKASIVILNWNGGAEDCLEAVSSACAQSYPNKEIIFVDNGSTDNSCHAVKAKFPNLIYVELKENIGCPPGRNVGAKNASGDLIFFLENDGAWNSEHVVAEAIALFEQFPDLGAAYTKVNGYRTGVVDPTIDGYPAADVSDGLYLSSSFRGGASIVRASIFDSIGGFPNDFFRQAEERFVSLQLYELGYKTAYWPKYIMRHKGSDYSGKSITVPRFNYENELKTVIRLYPISLAWKFVPLKCVLYFFRFLKRGDLIAFYSITLRLLRDCISPLKLQRISMKKLNIVEHLRRGSLQLNLLDENTSLDDLAHRSKRANHVSEAWKYYRGQTQR